MAALASLASATSAITYLKFGLAMALAVVVLVVAMVAVRLRMARGGGGAVALGARMALEARRRQTAQPPGAML